MSIIIEQYIELEGSMQIVFDNYKKQKKDYMPLMYNVSNSDRAQENHIGIGALSQMSEWQGEVNYDEIQKGFETNYRHVKYSTGQQIQSEVVRFKEFAEIKKRANKLAYAVHKTIQVHAAYPFNYAFDSTVTGGDSKPLCSSAHRIVPGDSTGSQSNTGTYDMTVANIETIKRAGREFKDDRGDIMDVNLSLIITGTWWEKTAKQICGSDKEPYTAENQKNIYSDELNYIVNPFITGKKWFLVDPSLMKGGEGLNWYWAQKPSKVEYKNDFDTEVGKYKVVGIWSKGFDAWYWCFGNNPS